MKIAIIGAGLYGCYIANKLSTSIKNINIDLYEKNNQILLSAASNNQSRLHYGFHYPRSNETIRQTHFGSKIFKEEFNDCIFYPKKNYYAVHKKSIFNFNEYLKILKDNNIDFENVSKKEINLFKNPDDIEGIINTGEGVIILSKLKKKLINQLKINNFRILNNIEIKKIDKYGNLRFREKNIKYYYIINTTYTNPNLGLDDKNNFKVKYELAGMVLLKNKKLNNVCVTIMDGDFISLYPRNKNLYTLSSVKFTPIKRFRDFEDFNNFYIHELSTINLNNHKELIINDAKQYLINDALHGIEDNMWIAPKVKITSDLGDTRVSSYKKNNRVISLMCGKIDAIPLMFEEVLKEIK